MKLILGIVGMKKVYPLTKKKLYLNLYNDNAASGDTDIKSNRKRCTIRGAIKIIADTISSLPTKIKYVGRVFVMLPRKFIFKTAQDNITESILPYVPLPGVDLFAMVLAELDKFKKPLGGAPVFGARKPTINFSDSNRFMFGVPMSAVKDWLFMTLENKWRPAVFWKGLGELFGVKIDLRMSQYENAHIRIQRFGLLISNKERFFETLDNNDTNRYYELSQITGLAWHPDQNAASVEKEYIEFIEQFLTVYFENAKQKGPDAMVEYFNAFHGVCLEDRARNLVEYAIKNPMKNNIYTLPPDWGTEDMVETAYMKEAQVLALQLHDVPTPEQLFVHLISKGVFDLEFTTYDGKKSSPSKEGFDSWAKEQFDAYILKDPNESSHTM